MYGNFDGIFGAVLIFGAAIGAGVVGAAWAFFKWVWPVLKVWLHAITA